jgi:hypothetical protein
MVAVPFVLAVHFRPVGNVPVSVNTGAGVPPELVTVKVKAFPAVAVALAALVMVGAMATTVRTKAWVTDPAVLVAFNVSL